MIVFFVDVPSQATIVVNTVEQFTVGPKAVGMTCGRMYDKLVGWSTGTDLISRYGDGPLRLVTTNDTGIAQRFFFDSYRPKIEDSDFGPAMKVLFFLEDDSEEPETDVVYGGKAREMTEQIAKIRAGRERKRWFSPRGRRILSLAILIVIVLSILALLAYLMIEESYKSAILIAIVSMTSSVVGSILTFLFSHAQER